MPKSRSRLGASDTKKTTYTWKPDTCGILSIKAVADVDNTIHECDENNNDKQNSIEVDGPDLIIQDITWPSGKICLDKEIEIEVTTANVGKCDAEKPFKVTLYIENNEIENATIASLGAGNQEKTTFSWKPDTCGILNIKAVADVDNTIHECDENNNEKQKSIEVDGPDLIIQDITWPSGIICLDHNISIEVTTANVGKCDAEKPFKVTLYVENIEVGNVTIDSLDANATKKPSITWKPDTCGILSIKAVADVDNTIHECDENNNEKQKSIEVDGPDLIIQDITWPSGIICLDHEISIDVTTANVGKCPAAGPFIVKLYIDSTKKTATINHLENGSSIKSTFSWTPDTCGSHTIKAVADSGGNVHECDENNNGKQKSIEVDGPDLIVKEISPASEFIIGVKTDITVVVKNQGSCAADRSTSIQYYDGSTLITSDTVSPLAQDGGEEKKTFTWTPTTCGIHTIKAVADAKNAVHECDENNNQKSKSVEVKGPDLVVDQISVSSPTTIGSTIKFTVAVKNKGTAAARKSSYLQCSMDGSALGSKLSVPNLASGQSSTHEVSWKASGCGPHTFKAVADVDLNVIECNENNNDKQTSFTVKCPDLIIESITSSPGSPAPNQQVTFSVVVKNKGDADAGDSTLKCIVGSTAICTESAGKIPAGKTSTWSCTWTGSGCAEHNFKAVADAVGNKVTESDETNNEKIRAFSVVDSVKPTITIDSPLKGATSGSSSIKEKGSASDNSGVAKVEVKVNDGEWQQASGTTSWSATVSLSEGANTITAKATDICGNEQSTSITVHYNPSTPSNPDFTISIAPSSRTICAGESATYTVSLTAVEGFSSSVSLSVSGQPSGATAVFDSTSVTPTGSTTLTIDTPPTTSERTFTITVTGTGGGETHQATAKLVISSVALPNLLVEDISWIPENPESPGDPVDFYITIKNEGSGDACNYPIYVDFIYCENYYDRKEIENGLKSGDTATVIYEGMGAFSCELTAIVDPFDGITESTNEDNTRKEMMLLQSETITAKIVDVSGLTAGVINCDDTISADCVIKNTGNVEHTFWVSLYINHRKNQGIEYETYDKITLLPGATNEDNPVHLELQMQCGDNKEEKIGTWDAKIIVWKNLEDKTLIDPIAGKCFFSQFYVGSEMLKAEIVDASVRPEGTNYCGYKPISANCVIKNTGNVEHTFWVSLYINHRENLGIEYETYDKITLLPDATNEDNPVHLELQMQCGDNKEEKIGTWDAKIIVWKNLEDETLIDPIAGKCFFNQFNVATGQGLAALARARGEYLLLIDESFMSKGCVCPNCGYEENIGNNKYCENNKCPKCGLPLEGYWEHKQDERFKQFLNEYNNEVYDVVKGLSSPEGSLFNAIKSAHDPTTGQHSIQKMVKTIDKYGNDVRTIIADDAFNTAYKDNKINKKMKQYSGYCIKEAELWENCGDKEKLKRVLLDEAWCNGCLSGFCDKYNYLNADLFGKKENGKEPDDQGFLYGAVKSERDYILKTYVSFLGGDYDNGGYNCFMGSWREGLVHCRGE
jgi:subtilase family serine protease